MASKVKNTSRRSRAAQACTACRKNKARCELLDDLKTTEILRCHRCKTLDLLCSYQDADRHSLRLGRKSGISQAWEQLVDFSDVESVSKPNPSTTTTFKTITTPNTESHSFTQEFSLSTASSASLNLKALPQSIWKYRRVELGQWRYFGNDNDDDHYDWSAPMSAIHQISAQIYDRPSVASSKRVQPQPELLEDILEQSQIEELLRIFHHSFSPWLGFSIIRSNTFPLLNLVCCTIATRKLSLLPVADRLLHATEHAISQIILRPPPTYALECIQALILIALWTPSLNSNEPEEGWRDPHLIISSAVSLATKIRLNEAPERYSVLRKMRDQGLEVDPLQLTNSADLARLWISLTNVESILCMGTHRTPFSHRDKAYLKCFPRYPSNLSSSVSADNAELSDVRLRLLAETLSATEEGLSLRLNSMEEFELWHYSMTDALQRIDSCTRTLLPLRVALDLDQTLSFRAQIVVTRCCRLLVMHNPVDIARRLSIRYGRGMVKSRSHSNVFAEVFTPWGKDALQISKEVFVSLQELSECLDRDVHHVHDQYLASAPDFFFHLIQLAGVFLISFKFMVFNARRSVLPGPSELLLERLVQHLRSLQVPKAHPAKRCADLLGGLLDLWSTRDKLLSSLPSQQISLEPTEISSVRNRVERYEQERSRDYELNGSPRSSSNTNSPLNASDVDTPVSGHSLPTSLEIHTIDTCVVRPQDVMAPQPSLDLGAVGATLTPIFNGATTDGMIENSVNEGWSNILQDTQFWQNFFMHQPMSEQH